MSRRRVKYSPGDWVAVPLAGTGYGLGLISRADNGFLLGYFFGPSFDELPEPKAINLVSPNDVLLICLVGDEAVSSGRWPLIHRSNPWDPTRWPLPAFSY